jgi:hypothetical protein
MRCAWLVSATDNTPSGIGTAVSPVSVGELAGGLPAVSAQHPSTLWGFCCSFLADPPLASHWLLRCLHRSIVLPENFMVRVVGWWRFSESLASSVRCVGHVSLFLLRGSLGPAQGISSQPPLGSSFSFLFQTRADGNTIHHHILCRPRVITINTSSRTHQTRLGHHFPVSAQMGEAQSFRIAAAKSRVASDCTRAATASRIAAVCPIIPSEGSDNLVAGIQNVLPDGLGPVQLPITNAWFLLPIYSLHQSPARKSKYHSNRHLGSLPSSKSQSALVA